MNNPNLIALSLVLCGVLSSISPAQPIGDELDEEVAGVFREKCVACHDQQADNAGGDVDFLLDFVALIDPDNYLFDETDPESSRLQEVLMGPDAEMPKRQMKDIQWNGPLGKSELQAVTKWIGRGGPSEKYLESYEALAERDVVGLDKAIETIALDIQKLKGRRLEFARYLTITNLHNNQSIASDELELYRQGVVKLLNSLSHSPDVLGMDSAPAFTKLVAVDKARTIFRFDLRDIGWEHQDWEKVVEFYPYGLTNRDGFGKSICSLSPSELPFLRADWFVFATAQPPLYHDLLKIERNLQQLEKRLGIKRAKNIRQGRVARAGFGKSGVSRNNRLVERHSAGANGSYWISYDFGGNAGKQNLFENPLGPPGILPTDFSFHHDGGEVIYTLPNGFQAYVLAQADGQRLSIAPSSIVHDDSMTGGQIINGISCISCHYQGMKPENKAELKQLDQIRENAEGAYVQFSQDELERIHELYPARNRFAALVQEDRQRFKSSMAKAGLSRDGATEPVRALFNRFARDVDEHTAAAGFGLSVERFEELMKGNEMTRRNYQRISSSGLQRQNYVESFATIAPMIGYGRVREFTPLRVPYFGFDPESGGRSEPQSGLPGLSRLDGKLSIKMNSKNGKDTFKEGEKVECYIRTNEDCYVTVVAVDPSGEATLLLPNSQHEELKIEAGRRYQFPTPEMVEHGMELVVSAPHGATEMIVVGTKRPLPLEGVTPKKLKKAGLITLSEQSTALNFDTSAIEKHFAHNEWATYRWTCRTLGRQ